MDEIILKMKNFIIENKFIFIGILLVFLVMSFFLDKGLSVGFGLIIVLSGITLFVLNKLGFKDKRMYLLFLIALMIHISATLFIHYSNFPLLLGDGGDYIGYQKSAIQASQCFRQGIFSIKDIISKYPDFYTAHYYPIIVGFIYALTLPEEIIGLMLNVWLVAVSIIFLYLIVLEVGNSERSAFIIGLLASIYPSYIFNTSLLLKDAIEVCSAILVLLLIIKIIKRFSWYKFLAFYLAIFCVTHFRFYIGYALIVTFLLSWFLISKLDFKKRLVYGIIFIILLGFVPQISAGQGYFGKNSIEKYLNFKTANFYRHTAYNPITYGEPIINSPSANTPSANTSIANNLVVLSGLDSSFTIEKGPIGYIKSFIYVLLGPFPWQVKNLRQSLALIETIPWYLLLFFIVNGIIFSFKTHIKNIAPLLIFSIIVMVVIAIFDTNFGLIVRIRIPAFLSLLCIASFKFNKDNIIYKYLNKIYGKIFSHWWSRFYWIKHS